MNYIKQLNVFYSTLDYNPLSTNAIALYQYLLHIAYCLDSIDEFTVANTTLISKLKITIKELQNARNELITRKLIFYKKGSNQNKSPKYCIARLYEVNNEEKGQAEGYLQGQVEGQAKEQAEGQAEGYIITILYLYFNYIINNGVSNFQNITEDDKKTIITLLKRMQLYIENKDILKYMTEERLIELQIQYWAIKEIYFSPYKVFLKNLTQERITFRFLKTKQYVDMYKQPYKFLNYFIKSLQEDFYKNPKEDKNNDNK